MTTDLATERLAAIVTGSDDAIIGKDLNGIISSWNQGAENIFGYTSQESIGQPITFLLPPERLNEEIQLHDQIMKGARVSHFESKRICKDGRQIDISATISPVFDGNGIVVGASNIARDISHDKKMQQTLLEAKQAAVLEVANEEKVKLTAELLIANEEKAKRAVELVIANVEKANRAAELVIAEMEKAKLAAELVIANVEKANRAAELVIANTQALYDPLTKLPNRRLFVDRFSQVLLSSRRSKTYTAMLYMDLDGFKAVNDFYGHAVGDLLLTEVAQRIKNAIRDTDTVARFGGDEFVVLLGNLDGDVNTAAFEVEGIAKKILSSTAMPVHIDGDGGGFVIQPQCTISIGASLFLHTAGELRTVLDGLLALSDKAMYQAKKLGGNRIQFDGVMG